MFKAHVHKDWVTDEVEIYLMETQRVPGARSYFTVVDGRLQGTTVTEGAPLQDPLMRLPFEAFEALVAAMSKVMPPSQATVVHLEDARAVRDRLLAIVESISVRQ